MKIINPHMQENRYIQKLCVKPGLGKTEFKNKPGGGGEMQTE